MAHRPLVLTLAAGAALTASTGLVGCSGKTSTSTPPPDTTQGDAEDDADKEAGGDGVPAGAEQPPVMTNPPPPPPPITNPPPPNVAEERAKEAIATQDASLPAWDDVPSGHPPGATNPPSPVLIVTPDGTCYKRWEGGMIPSGGDRVEVVTADGATTAINCPEERATKVYEDWVAAGRPDPTEPGFP